MGEVSVPLSGAEAAELAALETVIQSGVGSFVEVGQALARVRDALLYRATHGTFEEYCRQRWGFSRPHSYRLMESAEVASRLEMSPNWRHLNEGQVRELARLPTPPEQVRAFEEAVSRNGTNERKRLTALDCAGVVQEMITVRKTLPEEYARVVAGDGCLREAVARAQAIAAEAEPVPKGRARVAAPVSRQILAAHIASLPEGTYSLLYADPVWPPPQTIGDDVAQRAGRQLPPVIAGCQRSGVPVREKAAPTASLFLWTPPEWLEDAMGVMEDWGFHYQTNIVWYRTPAKESRTGGCLHAVHEHLLIGWRGRRVQAAERVPSFVAERPVPTVRGREPRKPEIFLAMIERLVPKSRRLVVMGSIEKRSGWELWAEG